MHNTRNGEVPGHYRYGEDPVPKSFAQRPIIDADGDGVEDNVKKTQGELDRFRKPVFGVGVEDMHNTHNGEVPGHVRAYEDKQPTFMKIPQSVAQIQATDFSDSFWDSEYIQTK
jgi:hypothetical protein